MSVRINRYIMECKLHGVSIVWMEECELIDTLWNVNCKVNDDLADSYCRINRYIMECKFVS